MGRFDSIYPFTTENITGYMNELDLTNKKIITVTGSTDHILNAIVKGSRNITTFDINPLTKYYMDLKIACIKELEIEEFLDIFLYNNKYLDKDFISNLDIDLESKEFWNYQLYLYGNYLMNSNLFNKKYFNSNSKIIFNMYLDKDNYNKVKNNISNVNIKFLEYSLQDLELKEEYDYMFLSNISDYINLIFSDNYLYNYKELIDSFLDKVNYIYFAYLYDYGSNNPRSEIDNIELVKRVFNEFKIKTFNSALEGVENKRDSVLILRRK